MSRVWENYRESRAGVAALAFIVLMAVLTVLVPLIYHVDPTQLTNQVLRPPSGAHLLGTDELGRDVLQGLVYGIRVSLYVGIAAAIAASVLGILIGAWAGFFGGRVDFLLLRIAEIFQVMPTFVLAAVIVAMLGPGLDRIVAVIALMSWPHVALVMRGEVLRVKQMEYVDAMRCLGYREGFILLSEVVPNAVRAVLAICTLIVGQAILTEAALGFLGLSSPDVVSWGRMLNSGQQYLLSAWWLSVVPGIAIFLTVLAFNLVGDAVDSALNPQDNA